MGERICILLRHGDYHQRSRTPSAHQPFPLSDVGNAQAHRAVELLKVMSAENGWELHPSIHSSSLLRAWQTSQIIRDGLGLVDEIVQTDHLAERSVGAGANLSSEEIASVVDQDPRYAELPSGWKSDSHFRLPFIGAESLMQAGERTAKYITEAMQQLPGDDSKSLAVVFVGHGAAFRHAACHLGALQLGQIAGLSMYHAQPVALQRGADGNWFRVAGDWKVRDQDGPNLD